MSIRSQRRTRRYVALGLFYFALASLTIATTRVGNGVAILFVANALLAAYLIVSPHTHWRGAITACGIGSIAATSLFGFGPLAAPLLAAANMVEALVAATLYRRLAGERPVLTSMTGLLAFVAAAVLTAPAASAVLGAFAAASFGGDLARNSLHWFSGHALGMLTFAPLFLLVAGGELRVWAREASALRRIEAAGLLLGVAGVALFAFSPLNTPLLFLPLLGVLVATFRLGRLGATSSVIVLAFIGGGLTIAGSGPIATLIDDPVLRLSFFQFYLAVTTLTVLPVAAELARRKEMFARMQESEARYRLLAENSSDIILDIDLAGRIIFASPAIQRVGGYDPDEVVGWPAIDLVDPEDVERVQEAHRLAIATPGRIESVEYRGLTADGRRVWMETRTQAIFDEFGTPTGAVSAIRNVEHRKALERALALEADTDGLTGVLNRRAFMRMLTDAASSNRKAERGCLALFDLDHFKGVNDTHGHGVGDQVLIDFVTLAQGVVRDTDSIGRLGGEEFAILLRGASWEQAETVCERLRAACADRLRPAGSSQPVTVSAGVADITGPAGQAMQRADAALYRAKRAGRNRLVLAA